MTEKEIDRYLSRMAARYGKNSSYYASIVRKWGR